MISDHHASVWELIPLSYYNLMDVAFDLKNIHYVSVLHVALRVWTDPCPKLSSHNGYLAVICFASFHFS